MTYAGTYGLGMDEQTDEWVDKLLDEHTDKTTNLQTDKRTNLLMVKVGQSGRRTE